MLHLLRQLPCFIHALFPGQYMQLWRLACILIDIMSVVLFLSLLAFRGCIHAWFEKKGKGSKLIQWSEVIVYLSRLWRFRETLSGSTHSAVTSPSFSPVMAPPPFTTSSAGFGWCWITPDIIVPSSSSIDPPLSQTSAPPSVTGIELGS